MENTEERLLLFLSLSLVRQNVFNRSKYMIYH